jgi:hypothetical protein
MDELEIFNVTEGGRAAVAKVRHQAELLHPSAAKPAGTIEAHAAAASP